MASRVNKEKNKKYALKVKAIFIVLLAIIMGALLLLKLSQKICEWYSRNISAAIVKGVGIVTDYIPISMYEILIYAAVALLLIFVIAIIVRLCKKRWRGALSAFCNLCLIILSVALLYVASASLNYSRAPVDIPLYAGEVNSQDIYTAARAHIDRLNYLALSVERDEDGNVVSPYTLDELADKLQQLYDDNLTSDYFSDNKVSVKQWLVPRILAEMHISGVFFAPTAEANINMLNAAWALPVTTAHEMAHAKGVMRESDANLTAYYITMSSDDAYIAYSGCMYTFTDILDAAAVMCGKDKYKELCELIDKKVLDDIFAYDEIWSKYNKLSRVGEFFNNIYLKLSGTKDGTGDYNPSMGINNPSGGGDELIIGDGGNIIIGSGESFKVDEYGNIIMGDGSIGGKVVYTDVQKMTFGLYL
ncbi:MAG: DUF3810 domain-containing protein [Clostridia bacterium]|nr:DUF3810 domain-containing protein [Clostridia bacterium]